MIVGLTGGIASGKSTAAQYFRECGARIIDADSIAHELLASEPIIQRIVQHFGAYLLQPDGKLNRPQLRAQILQSSTERLWLEKLLHPHIKAEILRQSALKTTSPYTVVEIPLLIEAGFQDVVDRILVVDCTEEQQMARLKARTLPPHMIPTMLQIQAGHKQRLAQADDVIENNHDLKALKNKVLALHQYYVELIK